MPIGKCSDTLNPDTDIISIEQVAVGLHGKWQLNISVKACPSS